MFEIVHASAMIGKLLDQLPADLRAWLAGSYWYFMAACLGLIVWRLSHSKDTLPHGEVRLTWYKPSQWLRRWLTLREQGYANAPAWYPRVMNWLHTLHNLIGAVFVLILAVFCFAMAYVWDDVTRFLWVAGGVLGLRWTWFMVKREKTPE
jgi:hypothetical protein